MQVTSSPLSWKEQLLDASSKEKVITSIIFTFTFWFNCKLLNHWLFHLRIFSADLFCVFVKWFLDCNQNYVWNTVYFQRLSEGDRRSWFPLLTGPWTNNPLPVHFLFTFGVFFLFDLKYNFLVYYIRNAAKSLLTEAECIKGSEAMRCLLQPLPFCSNHTCSPQ